MSDSLKFNALLVAIMLTLAVAISTSVTPAPIPPVASPYCTLTHVGAVPAIAAFALNIKTGEVIYEFNGDAQLPLASLTKTATALTALQILTPAQTVVISREALSLEGDSGLKEGEVWTVKDLVDFTLIESSNDGAHALKLAASEMLHGTETFTNRMNTLTKEAGMSQTYFINESGLDVSSSTAGAYGSARDIAKLMSYALKETEGALERSSEHSHDFVTVSGETHSARHTSDIATLIEGVRISKTGFTDLAGGNLAIVFDAFPGVPVAAVILGAERDERDAVMANFATEIREALRIKFICDSYAS